MLPSAAASSFAPRVMSPRGSLANPPSSSASDAAPAAKPVRPLKKELQPKLPKPVGRFNPMTPPPPSSEFPSYEPRDFFRFELIHQSTKSNARVGRIHTPHGVIDTPGYVAVGTIGALKSVPHQELKAAGLQLMFSNTYHLMLQPGPETIASAGGLHKFIGRDAPIITDSGGAVQVDPGLTPLAFNSNTEMSLVAFKLCIQFKPSPLHSGGFQVFSLAPSTAQDGLEMKSRRPTKHKDEGGLLLKKNENGVMFASYRDGSRVVLTPESSIEVGRVQVDPGFTQLTLHVLSMLETEV